MQKIKTKDVVAYTTLPRIIPRAQHFLFSGFGYLALLLAQIYAMVRLLPANHPYLDSKNMGRFGVHHVVAEASRHLVFKREHLDQLTVFFVIMAGIVLLIVQFAILLYTLFVGQAHAFSWFDTPAPGTDVAWTLLDRVFGVPGVFCNNAGTCTNYSGDTNLDSIPGPSIPLPFHQALHGLFGFYSTGLLLIATLIFLYFVFVVVLETATTGTPFGQRFQNVWVPIRLVVALGLLIPVPVASVGPTAVLNSGQFITLYIAKYGSSFATNGWLSYNNAISTHASFGAVTVGPGEVRGNPLGEPYAVLAIPQAPDMEPLVEAMTIVHACAYMYNDLATLLRHKTGDPPFNRTNPAAPALYPETGGTNIYTLNGRSTRRVSPWLVKNTTTAMTATALGTTGITGNPAINEPFTDAGGTYHNIPYPEALGFYYGSDIIIRFGEYALKNATGGGSLPVYTKETGYVKPLCGDIRIPITSLKDALGYASGRGGASYMQDFYYRMVLDMWYNRQEMRQFARVYTSTNGFQGKTGIYKICSSTGAGSLSGTATGGGFPATTAECEKGNITDVWLQTELSWYNAKLLDAVRTAWKDYVQNGYGKNITTDVLNYGWGGAGIWYTQIADINGTFIDAVMGVPAFDQYPIIMQEVKSKRAKLENGDLTKNPYTPYFISSEKTQLSKLETPFAQKMAKPLSNVYDYFHKNDPNKQTISNAKIGNIVMDGMNILLGTSGLMNIRQANAHIHPMAQLVAVGKGLVESAIRNVSLAAGTSFAGGLLGALSDTGAKAAGVASAISQILVSTAFMGLTAGLVLYYILPFLPFVYFYFAVGSWIKAIFEAMVGVPLWALAHLRIDGDGLPGDAAQNGYFLLLEIFIRPILTVVGLIAAIAVFSTQVRVLDMIWDVVTANVTGFAPNSDILNMPTGPDLGISRSVVDRFFFTVIYTIVCYMMALASFKMIDMIPDNILRWAGAGVSSFGDIDKEHAESLTRYAAVGGMVHGTKLAETATSTAQGLGSGLGKLVRGSK